MHTGSQDPPHNLSLKIKGLWKSVVHVKTKSFHILPFVIADLFLFAGSLVLMDLQVTNSFFWFCHLSLLLHRLQFGSLWCEGAGPKHSPPCAANGWFGWPPLLSAGSAKTTTLYSIIQDQWHFRGGRHIDNTHRHGLWNCNVGLGLWSHSCL